MLEITLLLFCVYLFVFYFLKFVSESNRNRTSSLADVTHSSNPSEISEEKSLSSCENRTPTSEEEAAALKIQAIWRGTYIRKILKSREPGVSFINAFQKCFMLHLIKIFTVKSFLLINIQVKLIETNEIELLVLLSIPNHSAHMILKSI